MNTKTVNVDVFTKDNCPFCPKAMDLVKEMSTKYRALIWKQINVDNFLGRKEALNYGIPAVPAIVINGRLIFVGLPTKEEFEEEIQRKI